MQTKEFFSILISLILLSTILKSQTVIIDLKVFLEGAYNSGTMTTEIHEHLPLSQPFNKEPWNYEGEESVSEIPNNVVDWVLVELRHKDNVSQVVKTQAAFILNDGHIVSLDGDSPLGFPEVENNNYFVAIKHRNHLSVLSSSFAYCSTCPDVLTVSYGGKTYNTVQIGDQCWLRENLDIGTMIQGNEEMTDNDIIEKYCYDNDPSNCEKYGGLYQWTEGMNYQYPSTYQGICPDGFHVPLLYEIQQLIDFVNNDAGSLVDQSQTTINYNATNTSGFSALFGGFEGVSGLGENTFFWTSSKTNNENFINVMQLVYFDPQITIYGWYYNGTKTCIRCLKD